MSELETIIKKEVEKVVPHFEKLELRATVGSNSYSVEFFATVNGKRMQCYEMADNGLIDEDDLEIITQEIAKELRKSPEYKSGQPNKFSFVIAD